MRKRSEITNRRGFTLLELLLSISILVVITAIVYASFASVVNTTTATRASIEEIRLRQFLTRSLERNFATVYSDTGYEDEAFRFVGISEDSVDGPQDSVRFCSSAPLIGGVALPGDLKEVRYEVLADLSSEMEIDLYGDDEEEEGQGQGELESPTLQVSETPLLGGNVQAVEEETSHFVADESYESPSWSVPVRSMDIEYFTGVEWVEEWDSQEVGRMPWAAHVRINFARTEEQLELEKELGFDPDEDPDFELIIPIQVGMGVRQDLRVPAEEGEEGADETEPGGEDDGSSGGNTGEYIPDNAAQATTQGQGTARPDGATEQ